MSELEVFFSQFGQNSGYVRELYELFRTDPSLVGGTWAELFSHIDGAQPSGMNGHAHKSPTILLEEVSSSSSRSESSSDLQRRVTQLLVAYRARGHYRAKVNPLSHGVRPLPEYPDTDVSTYKFTGKDLEESISVEWRGTAQSMKVGELIALVQSTYAGSIGFEISHIPSTDERLFLFERIESKVGREFTSSEKRLILERLIVAENFEASLHKKYVGQKRFSVEGGETIIPMLSTLLDSGSTLGLKEALIGMSHRGRLNVLANIVGKPLSQIFSEFEDKSIFSSVGAGDVKYHLGFSSTYNCPSGEAVRVYLAPNPSHLEFINPVLEGLVKVKQDLTYGRNPTSVLPILIHGDAAFAGQGVVYETLNYAGIDGYSTGGTIHIVVNNQVGFTATPEETRSTVYCTDLARGTESPIFHVNCEDVEAACWAMRLAIEYRMRFKKDVFIDLLCYRKYGHNEGDDPTFTQPLMYNEIKTKQPISKLYLEKVNGDGALSEADYEDIRSNYLNTFNSVQAEEAPSLGDACPVRGMLKVQVQDTTVSSEKLKKIAKATITFPDSFTPHPKLQKILEKRAQTVLDGEGIEWGMAENLAFGSLLLDGFNVRLSGQDCGRATFSQRHLKLDDFTKMETLIPINQLSEAPGTGICEVYNSSLSEAGVLGFEYGYSNIAERTLVLWEAQFGDFGNGAQVFIDQFISSSEAKWNFLSGVVLLLPHGYEGQGPEHSSARLERYLQLCAEGNMSVCYPSNAAQYFHLLRRQGLSTIRRPLIVMTPKSLLRLGDACATLKQLATGSWSPIISERFGTGQHFVFLTGKIYYDVVSRLKETEKASVQLVRIEELYPFSADQIKKILSSTKPKSLSWVQEEPKNMGAWTHIDSNFREHLGIELGYIGRPPSASTAAGSGKRHAAEQKKIVDEVVSLISR